MVDRNLFLYDLAVVAILKNEGHYLREWLDYHLLAGVDHFYLYDNGSTDNQAEVIKPYVEAGIVDYISAPGSVMQMPVYNYAVKKFRFHCRYMAFIDLDEFIYPKTNRSIVEVVDEILLKDEHAASLAMNWQCFGSNGQDKADYTRGVLERFTRRAPSDWVPNGIMGNAHVKILSNPRKIFFVYNPHCAVHLDEFYPVNENGKIVSGSVPNAFNNPVTAEKIVVNHYYVKSREEFIKKTQRGRCDQVINNYSMIYFEKYNHNEVFDDGILRYRAARTERFFFEGDNTKIRRVTNALTAILSRYAVGETFNLETALTCRALSTYLCEKYPSERWKAYEEASLAAILKSLDKISVADARLLIHELPRLLRLTYPVIKELRISSLQIISQLIDKAKTDMDWREFFELDYLQDFLRIKE